MPTLTETLQAECRALITQRGMFNEDLLATLQLFTGRLDANIGELLAAYGGLQNLLINGLPGETWDFASALFPTAGMTYVRAGTRTGTVTDFEGFIRVTKDNELRLQGLRVVENLVAGSNAPSTQAVAVTIGARYMLSAEGTGSVTLTDAATGVLSGSGRFSLVVAQAATANLNLTIAGSISRLQVEQVPQAVSQPSEYVSNGALSSPFHGFFADGVRYFPTDRGGLDIPAATRRGQLIEAASTNYILFSRDLSNAAWTLTNMTAARTALGIDDQLASATTLTATLANATVLQARASAAVPRAASFYLRRRAGVGAVEITVDGGATWTAAALTSSWQRFSLLATVLNPSVGIRITTSGDAVDADGIQCEDAGFVTSFIPTTAAAVARARDDCRIATLGPWYNQATGTFYTDCQLNAATGTFHIGSAASDGTPANEIALFYSAGLAGGLFVAGGGGSVFLTTGNAGAFGVSIRAALAYALNDFSVVLNGGAAATQLSGAIATSDRVQFGNNALFDGALNGTLRRATYYSARLPNTSLQSLTA